MALSIGAIVGIVVGFLVLVAIIVGVVMFIRSDKKAMSGKMDSGAAAYCDEHPDYSACRNATK